MQRDRGWYGAEHRARGRGLRARWHDFVESCRQLPPIEPADPIIGIEDIMWVWREVRRLALRALVAMRA